jgi:hypothetical protein
MESTVLVRREIQLSPVKREKYLQYSGIEHEFSSLPAPGLITILITLFQLRPLSKLQIMSAAFRRFISFFR